jgi:hypothetical protein
LIGDGDMDFLTGEGRLRITRNIAGGGGVVKKNRRFEELL